MQPQPITFESLTKQTIDSLKVAQDQREICSNAGNEEQFACWDILCMTYSALLTSLISRDERSSGEYINMTQGYVQKYAPEGAFATVTNPPQNQSLIIH